MITSIKNRSLISVTGEDSEKFLQSQFTNDIFKVSNKNIQISAFCQHQGKILVLVWVFRMGDSIILSCVDELTDLLLSKLNTFKFFSKVEFQTITDNFFIYGLIGENMDSSFNFYDNLDILVSKDKIDSSSQKYWELSCINFNIPEVFLISSEKFIPQALNLDIDELGVSFSKGCYPGQEVVARMHYLGKPKRRLFHFESMCEPTIGDSITVKESESLRSSGKVIRVAKIHSSYHLLGTLEVKHSANQIYLHNDIKKPLKIIDA